MEKTYLVHIFRYSSVRSGKRCNGDFTSSAFQVKKSYLMCTLSQVSHGESLGTALGNSLGNPWGIPSGISREFPRESLGNCQGNPWGIPWGIPWDSLGNFLGNPLGTDIPHIHHHALWDLSSTSVIIFRQFQPQSTSSKDLPVR